MNLQLSRWKYSSAFALDGATRRSELLERFHAPEEGYVLLKDRYLWKVIQTDRSLGLLEWRRLNMGVYLIGRERFLDIARYELPDIYAQVQGKELPKWLVCIQEPSPRELARRPLVYFIYELWGYRLQGEVAKVLRELKEGKEEEKWWTKLYQLRTYLGTEALEEVREVLLRDRMVLPEADEEEVLYTFVLAFCRWYVFLPALLRAYFPSIRSPKELWQFLEQLFSFSVASMLERTRPKDCLPTEDMLALVEEHWSEPEKLGQEWWEAGFHVERVLLLLDHLSEETKERLRPWLSELLERVFQQYERVGFLDFPTLWHSARERGIDEKLVLLCDRALSQVLPKWYKGLSWLDRATFPFWRKELAPEPPRCEYISSYLEMERNSWKMRLLWLSLVVGQVFLLPLLPLFWLLPTWMSMSPLGRWLSKLYFGLLGRRLILQGVWWELQKGRRRKAGNLARALFAYKRFQYHLARLGGSGGRKLEEKVRSLFQRMWQAFVEQFRSETFGIDDTVLAEERETVKELLEHLSRPVPMPYSYKKFFLEWQKGYVDLSRAYYHLSIWQWRFIPLDDLRRLRSLGYLQKLVARVASLPFPEGKKKRWKKSLHRICHSWEAVLGEDFRKRVASAFESVQVCPPSENPSAREVFAFTKVIDDFVSLLLKRKRTHYSHLRDVISTNEMAISDLRSPWEWLRGDQLLQLDRRLAREFPGVHRPGEVYMGFIHRLSSALFAWPVGRWFSKYLLLPFGGAFVVYEGLNYILKAFGLYGVLLLPLEKSWELAAYLFPQVQAFLEASAKHLAPQVQKLQVEGKEVVRQLTQFERVEHVIHLYSLWFAIFSLGVFFQFFAYTTVGRKVGYQLGLRLFQLFKKLLWELPQKIWNTPWIQAIYRHRIWLLLHTFLLKPALYGTLAVLPLYNLTSWGRQLGLGWLYFIAVVVANLFMNTPLGRTLFDYFEDRVVEGVHFVNRTLVLNLYHWTMEVFYTLVQWADQLISTVDDYFRFREGESRFAEVWKGIIGKVWYAVGYVFRFTINLIVEPQINPIKHFPIVTVSHKIILPFALLVTEQSRVFLSEQFGPTSYITWIGVGLVFLFTQFGIPGICGFIAWEFKENWRLYPHALSEEVQPVRFGSHGEDMLRLLRPGFHSGTLPKSYHRLRMHLRTGEAVFGSPRLTKLWEGLHHVEEDVERFLRMTLVQEWERHLKPRGISFSVGAPQLFPYRVTVPVKLAHDGVEVKFTLEFDYIYPYLYGYCDGVEGWQKFREKAPELASYIEASLYLLWKLAAVQLHLPELLAYLRAEAKVGEEWDLDFAGEEPKLVVQLVKRGNLRERGEIWLTLSDEGEVTPFWGQKALEPVQVSRFYLKKRQLLWSDYDRAVQALESREKEGGLLLETLGLSYRRWGD